MATLTEEQIGCLMGILAKYGHWSVPAPMPPEEADILRRGCTLLLAQRREREQELAAQNVTIHRLEIQVLEQNKRIGYLEERSRILYRPLSALVHLKDHMQYEDSERYERLKPGTWEEARQAITIVTRASGIYGDGAAKIGRIGDAELSTLRERIATLARAECLYCKTGTDPMLGKDGKYYHDPRLDTGGDVLCQSWSVWKLLEPAQETDR